MKATGSRSALSGLRLESRDQILIVYKGTKNHGFLEARVRYFIHASFCYCT